MSTRAWMEKQRNIIDFTLSSLGRRKGKNLALLLVYTLLIFLLASVMFFTHALRREASLVLQGAPDMVVQRMVAGRHDPIPADALRKVEGIRGVTGARGRLWGYYFDPVVAANYTLLVPQDFAHPEGTIVIGEGISRSRGAFTGDLFPLRAYNGESTALLVAAVLPPGSELVSSDLMLIGEKDFRDLFNFREGHFTDIVLEVRNSRETDTVAAKIVRVLPESRPITRREVLRTYDTIFDWRSGIIVVILLMKFWEGTVVSLTSFLAGALLAYLHVFFTSVVLFEPVLKGWSTLAPAFRLVPFIDPYQVATLFFLTVVPYTVATIIPSWRAATIDPDAVMRS